MVPGRSQQTLIKFESEVRVCMVAIDGTWRRFATMQHVSEAGCKLLLDSSIEGLNLKEFFLILSSPGLAYRRCEFEWVKGTC